MRSAVLSIVQLAAFVVGVYVAYQIAEVVVPLIFNVFFYFFGGLMLLSPVFIAFDWYEEYKKRKTNE